MRHSIMETLGSNLGLAECGTGIKKEAGFEEYTVDAVEHLAGKRSGRPPYNALYGEASPGRCTFFSQEVHI